MSAHMYNYWLVQFHNTTEGSLAHAEALAEVIRYRKEVDRVYYSLMYGTLRYANLI